MPTGSGRVRQSPPPMCLSRGMRPGGRDHAGGLMAAGRARGQQSLIGAVTEGFGGGQLIGAALAVPGPVCAGGTAVLTPPAARASWPP